MDSKFIVKVGNKIARQRQAAEELRVSGERARQAGDWDAYWNLTAPGSTGNLLTLISKEQEAVEYFRSATLYFEALKAWTLAQKRAWTDTFVEADFYLKARLYDQARAIYEGVCNAPTATDKSVHAIALINSGAVERGRGYLDWRLKNLDFSDDNTAPRWYHLGECLFWKGDYTDVLAYLTQAIERWGKGNPDPPVLGMYHLVRYITARNAADRTAAQSAFEASIRWFYREGDTEHAFDAHEYLGLLAAFEQGRPPTGFRIRGISFLRV